jgi:alkylation response protein AidB-like acyl-CoA dehydrogenase
MALVIVDPRAEGVTMRRMDIAMPAPERQFDVWFDDVHVAPDCVIGDAAEAFRYLFTVLNPERLLSAATQVGIGERALGLGVRRAGERAPFGVPIGSYQAIAHPLAHARAALDAARLMTYAGCEVYDAGGSAAAESNVAKLLAAEAAQEALDAAVQAHGGAAFDESSGLVSLWPLVRMGRIGPVSNEMILNHIAEHVLGLPKSY